MYSKARMTPVDGQNPPNNIGVGMCAVNLTCYNKLTNLKCRKSKEHIKFIEVSLFEFRHVSLYWDKVPRYFDTLSTTPIDSASKAKVIPMGI